MQHAYTQHIARLRDDSKDGDSSYSQESLESLLEQVQHIHQVEFAQYFTAAYNQVKRCKLGLHSFGTPGPTVSAAETPFNGKQGMYVAILFL